VARKACAAGPKSPSKAPEAPCGMLDRAKGGWRVALFEGTSDKLKGFLTSGPAGCGTASTEAGATVYKTRQEAKRALEACGKAACPP